MKSFIYRFFSIWIGIILFFIGLEVVLRINAFKSNDFSENHSVLKEKEEVQFFEYDPLLGWKGKPSVSGYQIGKHDKVWVSLNSLGFREKEFSPQKKTGIKRILILGDSQTWGSGVEQDERFSDVLEQLLKEHEVSVEVLNLGMTGYGTDQEFLLYQKLGVDYLPDLVIVAFYWNDLFENSMSRVYGYPKPQFVVGEEGKLTLTNVPVPQTDWTKQKEMVHASLKEKKKGKKLTFKNWLLRYSYAFQKFTNAMRGNPFLYRVAVKFGLAGDPRINPQSLEWRMTKLLLEELRSYVRENGGDFLVVVIPDRSDFEMAIYPLRRALIDDMKHLSCLDLYPSIVSQRRPSKMIYQNDIHLNAEGNRLIAEALSHYLLEKRSLK
ncbi:MAG: SGNH/GDSL hydrolase family protein [Chlamydiae bacterium]|nr:SGNH/GDSL hydrolase family protein [Chlamydiota bacterium]MBI3276212.1 SGNH/GDSL hydrolase family protein [Chlamydiota bacterium]